MFKDCITAVTSCHACQIFDSKTRKPPTLLQPVVVVGPFAKWGIDFMTCNPTSAGGHGYIIVVVDYFTKCAEAMPTLNNNSKMDALLFFNHVVSRFGVPQAIVTDVGSHFRNHMMVELAAKLGLSHDSSTPYYPQANGQVEAINKVLKRMLQRMIRVHKRDWHLILYSTLWAYRTSLRLTKLIRNESKHSSTRMSNLASSQKVTWSYFRTRNPISWEQGNSNHYGWVPYIVKRVLAKGAYKLMDYDGIPLAQPRNGLYLKRYYA
eukprot:PITA_01994